MCKQNFKCLLVVSFVIVSHPNLTGAGQTDNHSVRADQNPVGRWQSVDLVDNIKDFKPGQKSRGGELFLKEVEFMPDGKTSGAWRWNQEFIYRPDGKGRAKFKIKEIDGSMYLFFPWLSGDVLIRGQKPSYYVLRKISGQEIIVKKAERATGSDNNDKGAPLDMATAAPEDIIRIYGEPVKYVAGGKTFAKDKLPANYIMVYPNDLEVIIRGGRLEEVRHEGADGYLFKGKVKVGSGLEEVLRVVGRPKKIIEGKQNEFEDGVLYKDIGGNKGDCYYARFDQNVRFFFGDYKVVRLYITRSSYGRSEDKGEKSQGEKDTTFSDAAIEPVYEYDDVRWKDLSKVNLAGERGLICTLTFNQKTVWPAAVRMPGGDNPKKILADAMNPGLGIRELHRQGITGKGVNVAIIDQPLYEDHPEFAGKILAYKDFGCETRYSMHGPAVTSLLAGTNCGTAPDARVYYAAAPSWKRDTAYEANALRWIIEQNKKLPASEKIRVVSVSAAPSSPNVRDKNRDMWGSACAAAEAEGIVVLDCTEDHGFIGPCWYNTRVPESVSQCKAGYPGEEGWGLPNNILAPASPRTTAEEKYEGDFSYQYCGRGGQSWSIPYIAGVLAMGWQIRPELTGEQMRELLFQSAYTKNDGSKIINPKMFIRLVRKAKAVSKTEGKEQNSVKREVLGKI